MDSVTVIIPARNEEDHIGDCIDSIYDQLHSTLDELLVVDGESRDGTRVIAELRGARVLINYLQTKPYGFNLGIKVAQGDYILQVDAHSTLSPNYISECLKALKLRTNVVVGSTTVSVPGSNTLTARLIARIWETPFGRGRTPFRKEPTVYTEVTSMHSIMMPKNIAKALNGYNTKLTHTHDLEFNARLRQAGYQLIQIPGIYTYYKARSTIWSLIKKAWSDGKWVIYPRKLSNIKCLTTRHYIPLLFILTLPISIWPYILISLFTSKHPLMPIIYLCYHIPYGLGSLYAILNLWRIK